MSWNYRVVKQYHKQFDETTYSIHEVYYNEEGQPTSVSTDPLLSADSLNELGVAVANLIPALSADVLDFASFESV